MPGVVVELSNEGATCSEADARAGWELGICFARNPGRDQLSGLDVGATTARPAESRRRIVLCLRIAPRGRKDERVVDFVTLIGRKLVRNQVLVLLQLRVDEEAVIVVVLGTVGRIGSAPVECRGRIIERDFLRRHGLVVGRVAQRRAVFCPRHKPVSYTHLAGGLYIPDSAKEKATQAIVVAVGKGRVLDDGSLAAPKVKAGDTVLFGKYAGTEIKLDGEEHLIMREEDLIAVIDG